MCFNFFGDKIEQFPLAIDDSVTVSFDLDSREYNGRWFTSVRAWKVEKGAINAASAPASTPIASFDAAPGAGEGTDLPF